MKFIAVLFVLGLLIGIVMNGSAPLDPVPAQTQSRAEAARNSTSQISQQTHPAQAPPRPRTDALDRLPGSFAGTQVDGRLRADAAGKLIIDAEIRRVFDYFLASIGEEPLETSIARLRRYIEAELPAPAAGHAIRLLSQYLNYKRQLLLLEQQHMQQAGIDAMRIRLRAVQQLRAGIFDDLVHQTFFGLDEAADHFMLERLAIHHDPSLDASGKGAALDNLRNSLPAELQDLLAAQMQVQLREQTRALAASGGSSTELRQLRQQLVGNAAAARLERLDAKRRAWQDRVTAYRLEKRRIERSQGLGQADKRAAITRLTAERFDETERQRLQAAEQLVAAERS
ncbi:lipase secretion chaperone [Stutzerimonas xanthomarina]|uniref:Lipase chaperone n=2 Tax=Stutzerimonas xanthomarina TaxID=271420 RepID=A0A1M5M4W9_9GAMM|nr:lipase secretion chaperone [Stutzerimonas xanthomarina]MCP9338818.1 lipase secretion chaperone [Stutzerimonas xanthomarina]SEH92458.1 Lipase chaperone LimK [Stutzerimonas xanthomarina]SHG72347.1 Lipase chaperone LimK [Stutzerimonas xanthomarina DSM 18231]